MNIGLHGKPIESVSWPATQDWTKDAILANHLGTGKIWLSVTHHGDRDEIWIVEERGGVEFARHNPRFVKQIVWAPDNEPKETGTR